MSAFQETGLILFVSDYARSVAFYRDQVGLPVRFDKDNLTCFQWGGSYLLIEPAYGQDKIPAPNGNSPVLRLNVESIDSALEGFRGRGITAKKMEFDWGIVASFQDPDGYTVELCQWPESLYRDHPSMK
ncbi:MAG: VOC family protein [bacterium]